MKWRTGLGQDSHRFESKSGKPCVIAGLVFEDALGFEANSDGDVVFHAICNAISSLTGEIILGRKADELLESEGITDSRIYLEEATRTLGKQCIEHVAISLEGKRPHFLKRNSEMRESIAKALGIEVDQVGLTATTGEALTAFGKGEGVQCLCIVTTIEEE